MHLTTKLSHLASYNVDKYFPRFSYYAIISLAKRLVKYIAKYEKLGKYFSYHTRHHAITTTYIFKFQKCMEF